MFYRARRSEQRYDFYFMTLWTDYAFIILMAQC